MMEVHFDQVSHQFPEKPPVLRDITFTVREGTCTGLIGESGCGKTTLAQMVPRYYDPTDGTVLIDGRSVREYSADSLRQLMGIIPQTPYMLTGTVRENLCWGLECSDDELTKIIDLVRPNLWHALRNGLDTLIGEGGIRLSGGEKQCVMIMRALLRQPSFLLIDEATSNQDAIGQLVIQEALDVVLEQGLTAIMIAHRLSTTRDCDQIVVLRPLHACQEDESQIEAIATSHEELFEVSPTFRHLAKLEGLELAR